ncbi:hypothetical protein L202_00982 [Cryptococcus amylolentus CBS 6039]|uniref:Uncharacterized protein n=2 Tax=Cryptococcus amylolentus TaxID=104669 RepID=A0A1E3I217_9TREE|nr:hypothetical protein L202_00982 [Cryptococcus amylolentus CBS 6039]ODN82690.1 hypothetical protein L202_00982 [Cryptococcus amylolentus CBS 6039]ODO10381.1 hypothetical protein I350_00976 [Cryptococcus amylolentus CBS 6273]
MVTPSALKNVVVVGGPYVGTPKSLQRFCHRLIGFFLSSPLASHFHHLFAFPRFAIIPTHEHKAFIPYSGVFATDPKISSPSLHSVIRAKV